MKNSQYLTIILLNTLLFLHCNNKGNYSYEAVKADVEPYLQGNSFNGSGFNTSDTMIIYDVAFFETAIATLNQYKNQLQASDSIHNRRIINQLAAFDMETIQTKDPQLYLPFETLSKAFQNDKKNVDKILVWLESTPKQLQAAKSQLKTPDLQATKAAIETLTKAFTFISNDLTTYLESTNKMRENAHTIEQSQLAIKDFLAFLNSKIINGETLSL